MIGTGVHVVGMVWFGGCMDLDRGFVFSFSEFCSGETAREWDRC